MSWLEDFDERQQAEIKLSRLYANEYNHGTDGHNAKMIIAKMARQLDAQEHVIIHAEAEISQLKLKGAVKE